MNYEKNIYMFECRFCGRTWTARGTRTGFVKAAAWHHAAICRERTPKERRRANVVAEKRWAKGLTKSRIRNQADHPGLQGPIDTSGPVLLIMY